MAEDRTAPGTETEHNAAADAEVDRRYAEWADGAGQMPPEPVEPPPPGR